MLPRLPRIGLGSKYQSFSIRTWWVNKTETFLDNIYVNFKEEQKLKGSDQSFSMGKVIIVIIIIDTYPCWWVSGESRS
jgi:hypothetical protein